MGELLDFIIDTIVFVIEAIVFLILLTLSVLVDWFNEAMSRDRSLTRDDVRAFSVQIDNALKDPNTPTLKVGLKRTYQGFYDERSQRVVKARGLDSERVDSRVAAAHRSSPVVLYE
jgi:hypothetical protein